MFSVGFKKINGVFGFGHSSTSQVIVEQLVSPITTSYFLFDFSNSSWSFSYWLGKRSDPAMTLLNCQAYRGSKDAAKDQRCSAMVDIGAPVRTKGLRHPMAVVPWLL
jgi:hypothetical protein